MAMFDFDELTVRKDTNCVKWDVPMPDDVIPMWVADMDFRTAPAVIEAVKRRAAHGIYGYTRVPQQYYDAIVGWFARRHNWNIDPTKIIYTTGVVPALSAIIKGLTKPGDKVIIQNPAYNCFFSSIRNNGCQLSANELVCRNGRFEIDFDDLERRAADPDARLMIICNPHNPTGRLWSRDELKHIAQICRDHNVIAVSDEIHCELTYGRRYNSFAPIAAEVGIDSVVCVSPSKAFNIAGLQTANIVTTNSDMLARIDRAINDNEVCDINPFGVVALIAAYNEGEQWLEELCDYIWENYQITKRFFEERHPQYSFPELEATYLMWIDVTESGLDADTFAARLLDEGKVMLNSGTMYSQVEPSAESNRQYVRLNLACPRARLEEALSRIDKFLSSLKS